MSWAPRLQTRFVEPVLRNMKRIAERDHEAVVAYYNAQADGEAAGVVLEKFAKITNTRYYELFFDRRVVNYPVLVVGPDESDAELLDGYVDGKYAVLCEVWTAGSDPELLKAKLARYATVVTQMYVAAGFNNPADFTAGAVLTPNSGVDLSLGKHKYRPIKSAGPNFYQDMVQIPFKLSYVEG
jgi:hypothetical protein